MKKTILILLVISISLFIALAICVVDHELYSGVYKSELTIDFSAPQDEITHGATGFLYGLAEPNVPDGRMLYALSPKVLSTRVPNGLQHPSGDLARVSKYFFENGGQNIVIYMQDIYPDWYYAYRSDYLDTLSDVLDTITPIENADRFIYQPFNEMNNGVWYGDFSKPDNRLAFYAAFKNAYNLIKEKTNGAPVGGPAYTHYDSELIREFLEYCVANDCVPDVMIWHELFWYSTYGIRDTVKDYRTIEKELGLNEIRIIIDEYGTFKDIGTPGNMLQYVASFEETNVEGCLAFWRIPNNMNDLCADNNMPSSAWWLYQWYAQMSGTTYKVEKSSNTIPYFSGITTKDNEKITILCGGGEGNAKINLTKLDSLNLFKNAKSIYYEVEYLDFEGLTAPCLVSTPIIKGNSNITNGNSVVKLKSISTSRAYRIHVYPSSETIATNSITLLPTPTRYEAENGILNNAEIRSYDDIKYASSGGGVQINRSGSLTLEIEVELDGIYRLELAYLANPTIGNTRFNPRLKIYVDGLEEVHNLPNTLTSDASGEYVINEHLTKGKHQIVLRYDYGITTIDFIDVKYQGASYTDYKNTFKAIPLIEKGNNEYLVVVPDTCYYNLNETIDITSINNVKINAKQDKVFLEYGVNILNLNGNVDQLIFEKATDDSSIIYSIEYASNVDSFLVKNEYSPTNYYAKDVLTNHPITFNVYAEKAGYYALTTTYSHGQTEGKHAYNVKLVERYATIKINGNLIDTVYFANTYSNFTFSEKTIYVYLEKGNNKILFINQGEYVWNNLTPLLPNIASITISPIQ